jgi:thiol-disulfide isomerase/thioredoxin
MRCLFATLVLAFTQAQGQMPGRGVGTPGLAASHADAPGINWFDGDAAAAFRAAHATQRPVFLYWGAKWCPPCQQLKSSVFSRSDFIEKSRQFVAVYLDGDDPGAQKWGEKFRVSGYPTVIILRADQKEITRISGGMDLSLYADLLDIALSDSRPMATVIVALHSRGAALSHGDCQRLAYYAWVLADYSEAERKSLAAGLAHAARACTSLTPSERARLTIASAVLHATPKTLTETVRIVEDPDEAPGVADALQALEEPFFNAVKRGSASARADFVTAWTWTMDAVASNTAMIDADRLAALGSKLAILKRFSGDGKVPNDAAVAARAQLAATLAKKFEPYVRAGVVNSASDIYEQLSDPDAEYRLLKAELATAKTPYYYMVDLGYIEEQRGHAAESLLWFERAYVESKGVATRFQWGTEYLSALLRLAPTDHARIVKVGTEIIAELDGPDRIQARTRARLDKLDGRLRKWNAEHRYDADIEALHARMGEVCGKLPRGDSGSETCHKFLS